MRDRYMLYISDVIKKKRQGFIPSLICAGLYLGSLIFAFLSKCRNWAYDQQLFRQYSLPTPLVISIGNVVAGGTGKTPLTLLLAQSFTEEVQIAILSRGYGSKAEHLPLPVILCNREGPMYPPSYCGDEPYLLANNLPKSMIVVGKDRRESAVIAWQAGAQVILLDDGMQFRSLNRDVEIILINANDPFGQGYYLPRGFLRENLSSLSRGHLIVLNHVKDLLHYQEVKNKIRIYTNAPTVGTQLKVKYLKSSQGNTLESIRDIPVGIFCGIAHPEQFEQTVRSLGANIVSKKFFSDHVCFNKKTLVEFSRKSFAAGAKMLICTEKDFVKLSLEESLDDQPLLCEIIWLQMELSIIAGKESWNELIAKCKTTVSSRG